MKWNQTGAQACKERNMQIRSFAMLLPCGISLFSGVEFVCCPKTLKGINKTQKLLEDTHKNTKQNYILVSQRIKKTDLPIVFDEKETDSKAYSDPLSDEEDIDEEETINDTDSETNDYDDDYDSDETSGKKQPFIKIQIAQSSQF